MNEPTPLWRVAKGVPEELIAIVAKAMAKDRDKRYRSVSEMVKALMPLHDDLEARTTAAVARAVRDSVTPPPAQVPAQQQPAEAARAKEKIDTLSSDLLVTLDPGDQQQTSSRRWIWLLAAVGLVLAVILVVAFAVGGESSGDGSAEPGEEPSDTAVAATDPPLPVESRDTASAAPDSDAADPDTGEAVQQPPAVESVTITLKGLPPKAKLSIDGEPVENPFELPRAETRVELEVAAPGYVLYKKKFVPDEDRTLRIRLRQVGGGGKGGKGKKGDGWKTNPFG
jgi:hypothetical protein